MKLSRTVSYALQATLQLGQADSDHPVPCSRLAAEGKMPERFLLQILRNLVAHGVLESTRGVDGGYTLQRSTADITLLDIIEAVDGPMVSMLPVAEGLQPESREKLEKLLAEVNEQARSRLAAISLQDLLPQTAVAEKEPRETSREVPKPQWLRSRHVMQDGP